MNNEKFTNYSGIHACYRIHCDTVMPVKVVTELDHREPLTYIKKLKIIMVIIIVSAWKNNNYYST